MDPTGEYEIDETNKTIFCNASDCTDIEAAYREFSKNKKLKTFIGQYDNSDCKITINTSAILKSFIKSDGFKKVENLISTLSDYNTILSIGAELPELSRTLGPIIETTSFLLGGVSIFIDSFESLLYFQEKNSFYGTDKVADVLIDGIGFFGIEGAMLSLELKYVKKGILFSAESLALYSKYIEHTVLNKWSRVMFGVNIK